MKPINKPPTYAELLRGYAEMEKQRQIYIEEINTLFVQLEGFMTCEQDKTIVNSTRMLLSATVPKMK